MKLDVLGLQAFLAIAERGSFQRAAIHLNLSQTALSHRLRKLEDAVGVKLLARSSRQLTLTPAGLELLPRARRTLEDLAAAFQDLQAMGRKAEERVAIGCLPSIATRVLPRVLAAFGRAHPGVTLRIFDNSAAEIAVRVQSGEAEFGLTLIGVGRWDLDARPLMSEPFVLIAPANHPLARRRTVSWAELLGVPLVRVSSETGNRVLIDDALGDRRDALDWRFEVQRVPTAIALVSAGVALAIAPRIAFDRDSAPGAVAAPLIGPRVSRTIGVVTRHGLPLSRAASALLTLLEAELVRMAGGRARVAKLDE